MINLNEIADSVKSLEQHLGVVSTAGEDGKVESAVVYFTFDKDLNIYFLTRTGSRKYKNILKNPSVAFIAYSEYPPQTLQLEGIASDINDPKEQGKIFTDLMTLAKNHSYAEPPIGQMMESELAVMKITPSWARFGNFNFSETKDTWNEAKSN